MQTKRMTKKKTIKVLSLFDGISCARVALERAGFKVEKYFASEIDQHAVAMSQGNWSDIVHLGDVKNVTKKLAGGGIGLLIGGSPCQDLSIANTKRKGLAGSRSGLFYEYLRILKEVKPKYFVLENVASMPKEARDIITKELGVEPIMIDAGLVSAQVRKRLFWTNIPGVTVPKDRGIMLNDIIHETRGEDFDLAKYVVTGKHLEWIKKPERLKKKYCQINGSKAITMVARQYANWGGTYIYVPEATKKGYAIAEDGDAIDISFPNSKTRRGRVGKKAKNLMTSNNICVYKNGYIRKLTPIECERLQSLPDRYTESASDTQRYKAIGNGFNAEVIRHIISHIK